MIRNILFDMGGVLMRFIPERYIADLGVSPEDGTLLMREVFRSPEWGALDWGSLTEEEAYVRFCARLPERLHEAAAELLFRWDRPIIPVEGMEQFVRDLKLSGYRLFLLSNASVRQHEYWPRIPGCRYFEDTLVSADEHLVKPQPEIYLRACEKFGILPEESLFIDDVHLNIEGARQAGIRGIVFHEDIPELKQKLQEAGVKICCES